MGKTKKEETVKEEITAEIKSEESPKKSKKHKKAKKRKSEAVEESPASPKVEPPKKSKKSKKQKEPAPELSGKKIIFEFTSLPRNLNDEKFKSWLNKKVKHIHILAMRAIWNKTRPACYVDIDSVFKDQVLDLHGVSYNGSLVEVKIDEKGPLSNPRTSGSKSAEKDLRTIFIKGIPDDCVEDDLSALDIFSEATAIRIVKDRETGKSRGFGFAEFENVAKMEECMSMKRQAKVNGKNLFLDKCASDEKDQKKEGGGRGRGSGFAGGRGGGSRGGGSRGSRRGRGGFGDRASHGRVNSAVVSAKNKGSIQEYKGKRQTFDDSDDE